MRTPTPAFAAFPDELTSACTVLPLRPSRKKTWRLPSAPPETRFVALDSNVMKPPWLEIAGKPLFASDCLPDELTLTRFVLPFRRSRTKMSVLRFVSCLTRFVAFDAKAT